MLIKILKHKNDAIRKMSERSDFTYFMTVREFNSVYTD